MQYEISNQFNIEFTFKLFSIGFFLLEYDYKGQHFVLMITKCTHVSFGCKSETGISSRDFL